MDTPKWCKFRPDHLDRYVHFAKEHYGENAYQASLKYLEWLYLENPYSNQYDDFIIGLNKSEEIVGCIHKMRLPWSVKGRETLVPSLHNLVISEQYRSGAGFWLLKRSLYGEPHAIIPGVIEPLSTAYREMKCQQINTNWYLKILCPVKAVIKTALNRLSIPFIYNRLMSRTPKNDLYGYTLTTSPSAAEIAYVANWLNEHSGEDHVNWEPELVKWRFFHPNGPSHFLATKKSNTDCFFIMSIGHRKGLSLARLLYTSETDTVGIRQMMDDVSKIAINHGADVMSVVTTSESTASVLASNGFKSYKIHPDSYIYHSDKTLTFNTVYGPEVTDIGFESIVK